MKKHSVLGSLIVLSSFGPLACSVEDDKPESVGELRQAVSGVDIGRWSVVQHYGATNNNVIAIHAGVTKYGDVLYYSGGQYTYETAKACQTHAQCESVLPVPIQCGDDDNRCPGDQVCTSGVCKDECNSNSDCLGPFECDSGFCEWPDGMTTVPGSGRCIEPSLDANNLAQDCGDGSSNCHCNYGINARDGIRLYHPGDGVSSGSAGRGQIKRVPNPDMSGRETRRDTAWYDWDMFCSGQVTDYNGDILVAGGQQFWSGAAPFQDGHTFDEDFEGDQTITSSHFTGSRRAAKYIAEPFDSARGSLGHWAALDSMPTGRWYPTLNVGPTADLASGRTFIFSGHPQSASVHHDNAALEVLPANATSGEPWRTYGMFDTGGYNRYYPRSFHVPIWGGSLYVINKRRQVGALCGTDNCGLVGNYDSLITGLEVEASGDQWLAMGDRIARPFVDDNFTDLPEAEFDSPDPGEVTGNTTTISIARSPNEYASQGTDYSAILLPFECKVQGDDDAECWSDHRSYYPTKVMWTNHDQSFVQHLDVMGLACSVAADCGQDDHGRNIGECHGGRCSVRPVPVEPRDAPVDCVAGTCETQEVGPGEDPAAVYRTHGIPIHLPTGDILLTGGLPNGGDDNAGNTNYVEMYSPTDDKWYVGAKSAAIRNYHSVALLLQDGRVWSAGSSKNQSGGDRNGDARGGQGGARELVQEIFTPWYWNRPEAPVIDEEATNAQYDWGALHGCHNSHVTVKLAGNTGASAGEIVKASLIRKSSMTHAYSSDTRMIFVETEAIDDETVQVRLPKQYRVAPPGHYSLFLLRENPVASERNNESKYFIPSKGVDVKIVNVENDPPIADISQPAALECNRNVTSKQYTNVVATNSSDPNYDYLYYRFSAMCGDNDYCHCEHGDSGCEDRDVEFNNRLSKQAWGMQDEDGGISRAYVDVTAVNSWTVSVTVTDERSADRSAETTLEVRDTIPPRFVLPLPQQDNTVCDIDDDEITLEYPEVIEDCAENVLLTGQIVASDTMTGLPLDIPEDGTMALSVGTHTIRWTADDGETTPATIEQEITVLPGVFALDNVKIANSARVENEDGEPAIVANGGSGVTYIDTDAVVGDILSIGNVDLRDRSNALGTVISEGSVAIGNGANAPDVNANETVTMPPAPSLPAKAFAAASTDNVDIQPGQSEELVPGSYNTVSIKPNATLTLTSGDYEINSLEFPEPSSSIILDQSNGPVRIFVRDTLTVRGSFYDPDGDNSGFYLGYYGTQTVFMQSEFSGTLVAPNARLVLGSGAQQVQAGNFIARELELAPQTTLLCGPGGGGTNGPTTLTCTDGVTNGNETGVDCGGLCPNDCPTGQGCSAGDDCLSGVCDDTTLLCVSAAPSCSDNTQNGDESDRDCGGSCSACGTGLNCGSDSDCSSGTCIAGVCIGSGPTCTDGTQNGGETDVDCGGGCPGCANGQSCNIDVDCQNGGCESGLCQNVGGATCDDSVRNQDESDIDCGGAVCNQCPESATCNGDDDCQSGNCDGGTCALPVDECADGILNNSETDIDCGGGTCAPCADGLACVVPLDCVSATCDALICVAPVDPCANGSLDGNETDVDCGGDTCSACAEGLVCLVDGDCASGDCDAGFCAAAVPACDDGIANGDETDVDCGGGTCGPCADGLICSAPSDCASTNCDGGFCAAVPNCVDGITNGDETDVDCGGSCGACADLLACNDAVDCLSGVCTGGVCQTPACDDGVVNGLETDTDCGGGGCGACGDGLTCQMDGDCQSGVCDALACVTPSPASSLKTQWSAEANNNTFDNTLQGRIRVVNTGTETESLDDVTVRYYFTDTTAAAQMSSAVDHYSGSGNATPAIFNSAGDEHYIEFSFGGGASLAPGAEGTIQFRLWRSNWTVFDDTDDYSYGANATYVDSNEVPLWEAGDLVWGATP